MKHRVISRRRLMVICIAVLVLAIFYYFKIDRHYLNFRQERVPENFWGVTFSRKYATELGLDWKTAYQQMLTELKVKNLRLPIYWDDIEPVNNQWQTADYDWMLEEAEKNNVSVIAVIGRRQPRWPECHDPKWLSGLSAEEIAQEQLVMVEQAVTHFRQSSAITMWQLENEYFVTWFGNCPQMPPELLDSEINLLRRLDRRPLLLTDSGEFSRWRQIADRADIIGTTMYRVAWNQYTGYTYSAWPAWFYQLKAQMIGFAQEQMMVAELQAEPWPPAHKSIQGLSAKEIDKSFSLKQFATNSELARRTKFSSAYFWGVEWWYWRHQQGDSRYWNYARDLFAN